ncbi:hypothetical protein Tco_0242208 [Tanacetum coccineum]
MSNSNTNLQTQSSNALHNAIMEAGSKDRPPILKPCPNACEMWKAIERLKQGESINVQDLETNLYWEFGKFTSWDGESLESYYSWFYKMMNELVRNQCHVTNHQVNVQILTSNYNQNGIGKLGFINAEQADWKDDTDDESEEQELEAHYIAQDDQDETDDLDQERDLLASLIQKLKCEIDDSKNQNKILESSNKELVDKLKGEIEDFKTKNKSLELERISHKRTKNEVKTANQTWNGKDCERQSQIEAEKSIKSKSQQKSQLVKVQVNPEAKKSRKISLRVKFVKTLNLFKEENKRKEEKGEICQRGKV